MAKIPAPELEAAARRLLEGAGAGAEEAAIVARHCVDANLAGHDSHGIIQIPVYVDRVERGDIVPGAPFEILEESASTTVVDGHWGFGYVVSERAMRLTIDKARTQRVAATTVRRQGHVGRLADYPLMAAAEGMIGLMTADSGRAPKVVAPFGGREARLGTNPICIAVPSDLEAPLYLDIATSAAAAGKLKVAASRGEPVPAGWLIDAEGNPTTDPRAPSAGGAVLPLGGPEGHKGFGLSVIVEILSGLLPGLGFGVEPSGRHNDGCFMAAFDVAAFRPLAAFKQEVAEFARYLKATPPAAGVSEIYYPGEIEHRRAERARAGGVEVEAATCRELVELGKRLGVELAPLGGPDFS